MRKLLVVLALAAFTASADEFKMQCEPPFHSADLLTAANEKCGMFGAASADPASAHAIQNALKNNLCVGGKPKEVTFATFQKLQAAIVSKNLTNFTATKLPPDRSVFQNIIKTTNGDKVGEGTLVSVVGYVTKVKRGGKESVNCQVTKGTDLLDFHIVLVGSPKHDECDSITAEAIPHFRPKAWDAAKIDSPDVPVRFTGQLFLDASHKPCKDGKGLAGNPARFTSWELHPVYAIDVCKFASKAKCKASDASAWIPLEDWEEPPQEGEE